MGKFLYPIYKLELPSYKRWWLYHKASGVLSDLIEGNYLVLNNSLPKEFNLLQLVGNIIQDGEPSPENEVPILNVTGNANTKIQSKNLLEITENNLLVHCTYVSGANTNEYKLLCTASDMYVNEVQSVGTSYNKLRNGNLISCKFAETIYFNTGNELFNKNFFTEFDENFISLGSYNKVMSSGTYTPTNSNCKYVTLRFGYGMAAEAGTTYTLAPIVCKTNDTSYVPYQEQNLPLDLRSKNLLDVTQWKNGSILDDGGETTSLTNAHSLNFIKVLPNTSYIISSNQLLSNLRLNEYTKDKINITRKIAINKTFVTITTSENTYYLRWSLNFNNSLTITQEILNSLDLQLEEGTTATDYVPYYNYELSKIGTAKDYFFKNVVGSKYYNAELLENKWYLHKEVGKVVLDGSENKWSKSGNTTFDRFILGTNINGIVAEGGYSNYFKVATINVSSNLYEMSNNGNSQLVFNYSTYGTTTLEQFKTWVSTHNIELYYVLETPTKTEITETPLIEQLETFSKAKAYEGQTIIYGESDGSVPNYKVKYYMKGE